MISKMRQAFAWRLCVTSLALASFAATSHAAIILGDATPLDEIIASGDPVVVGDKVFTDFTYTGSGDMPPVDRVNVIPIQDDDGHYGVRFQGGFVDTPTDGASDALITFNVSVAAGSNMLISDAHLQANVDLAGPGLAVITETFLPVVTDENLTVFDSPGLTQLNSWIFFDQPYETIPVQKDILLLADPNGGIAATVSLIDQTFSQVVIPEPTSAAIAVLAIAGFGMRRRFA